VCGELWRVDSTTLSSIDDYEGVGKGHYVRTSIAVEAPRTDGVKVEMTAFAFFRAESTPELRESQFQKEYTLAFHNQFYRPIRHILVKQSMYLQVDDGAKLLS
jgi:hypothetical protein